MNEQINALIKALSAGNYDAAPSTLVQGAAYQKEDLSPVMAMVTAGEETIKLQKMLDVRPTKSNLYQYNRKLSVGRFGGSAALEGMLGAKKTGQAARMTVPMAYYVDVREHTFVADEVETFDGIKASERQAQDAALNLSQDIEFDSFNGTSDFSNAGVFDGNPAVALGIGLPNMQGLDMQVRRSDYERNAQDLMFASYGSNASVVFSAGGAALTQSLIEDISVRSALNMGRADKLMLDPSSLSAYNKISQAKERIILAGSPQEATGSHLRTQWTSSGAITLDMSQYLRKQIIPVQELIQGAPGVPSLSAADGGAAGSLLAAAQYAYIVTAANTVGEGVASAVATVTPAAAGNKVTLTIGAVSGALYYNVYRSVAGGSTAAQCLFIGRIVATSGGASFTDLGNRAPGALTGFLVQKDTMHLGELSGFKKVNLGLSQLSQNTAFYRWTTLAVEQPRKNALVENLQGQLFN